MVFKKTTRNRSQDLDLRTFRARQLVAKQRIKKMAHFFPFKQQCTGTGAFKPW